jgi:hypothetical protein
VNHCGWMGDDDPLSLGLAAEAWLVYSSASVPICGQGGGSQSPHPEVHRVRHPRWTASLLASVA